MCYSLLPSIFRFILFFLCSITSRHLPLIHYFAYFAGIKYLRPTTVCMVCCEVCIVHHFFRTNNLPSHFIICHPSTPFIVLPIYVPHENRLYSISIVFWNRRFFPAHVLVSTSHAIETHNVQRIDSNVFLLWIFLYALFFPPQKSTAGALAVICVQETHYSFSIAFTFIETHQRSLAFCFCVCVCVFLFFLPIWQN